MHFSAISPKVGDLIRHTADFTVLPAEQIVANLIKKIKIKTPTSFYGVFVDYLCLENEYSRKSLRY
jgi:hypothetical protein